MGRTCGGRSIAEVAVLDDNDDARDTMSDDLKLASFVPRPVDGPFQNIDSLIASLSRKSDAAVCDHQLFSYAPCTGAEAVSRLYRAKFPAVLVTVYFKADIEQIRRFRRGIPALLTPDQTSEDPDCIAKGFELCIREFGGTFFPCAYQKLRPPWPIRTYVF